MVRFERSTAAAARTLLAAAVACALLAPAEGAYRFGTLNWKVVKGAAKNNTVEFELVTAWRRDFHWVYVSQQPAPPGQPPRSLESAPIVGDKLRVTGLSFADETGAQAVGAGTSEILFHTGDGKTYFVDVTVTAFSASENWVMGVTHITHTYDRPFYSKDKNIYPVGYSYEASTGAELDANQPFSNTPWTAHFEGCCRWSGSRDANRNKPYKVVTHIDMTDRDNSPAARTLPIIVVPQAPTPAINDQPVFFVMAKDQYVPGSQAPVGHSGGTSNYEGDDKTDAPLRYKIALATDMGLAADKYAPPSSGGLGSIVVIDDGSGQLRMITNATGGALTTGYYQAAVRVDTCSARPNMATLGVICRGGTIIDFMVHVVPNDGRLPRPADALGNAYTPGGALSVREELFGWVGYKMAAHVRINNPRGNKVVLNYVFASLGVEGSSAETGAVQYSVTERNHQGLPVGAQLYATGTGAVVEVAISFDNPFAAHRPGHDAAMNKEKLDYSSAPKAKELWEGGFRPVIKPRHSISSINPAALDSTISLAAFDLNAGTGGAAVYLWLRKSDTEPAITELAISHCEEEEEALDGREFFKLPQDVNEQSKSKSKVHVWYKKGTGAAITDVTLVDEAIDTQFCNSSKITIGICGVGSAAFQAKPFAHCGGRTLVSGNLNYGNLAENPLLNGRGIYMYVQLAPDSQLRRVLEWTPQVAGHYIFCYAATEPGSPVRSSTQRCLDLDIKNDPVPKFDALPKLSTYMGKILTFTISYVDINHPDERVEIRDLKTGLQLEGARFKGAPTTTVLNTREVRTSQVVEWFPDATYGGFTGNICYHGTDKDGSPCTDVAGFLDSEGDSCQVWSNNPTWCAGSPEDGIVDMPIKYKNSHGIDPSQACCVCKKQCTDVPGFVDSEGKTCQDWNNNPTWCAGSPEDGVFDPPSMYRNTAGMDPSQACCVCKHVEMPFRHADVTTGCVNIEVTRCQWFVQTEDTLIQVAARFATNWLQIWHFNPTIMHPDSALPPHTLINIGHLYEVEPNDAMAVLAERFGTSIKHLRMNNWDLAQMPDAMLPLHKSICVIPNSCVTAAHVQRDVAA